MHPTLRLGPWTRRRCSSASASSPRSIRGSTPRRGTRRPAAGRGAGRDRQERARGAGARGRATSATSRSPSRAPPSSSARTPSGSCASCSSRGCAAWPPRRASGRSAARPRSRRPSCCRRRRRPARTRARRSPTLHGLYWLVAGLAAERPQLLAVDDVPLGGRGVGALPGRSSRTGSRSCPCCCSPPSARTPPPRPAPCAPRRARHRADAGRALGRGDRAALGDGADVPRSPPPATRRRAATRCSSAGSPSGCASAACRSRSAAHAELGRTGPGRRRRRRRRRDGAARRASPSRSRAPSPCSATRRRSPSRPRSRSCPRTRPRAAADQLVRAGILEDGRPLRFQHALVRDAVLDALTAGERAEAHRAAARLLAAHGAPPRRSPRTCCTPSRAATPRWPRRSPPRASRALAAGAAVGGARPARARARGAAGGRATGTRCCSRSRARRTTSASPEALEHVRAAYDAAGDEIERAHAALAVMWATGPAPEQVEQALRMIEPAIAGHGGSRPRARAPARRPRG